MAGRKNAIKEAVRQHYGERARSTSDCCTEGSSAERLYTPQEVQGLPEPAVSVSAGCGNPTALAGLRPGEVVLDLGSGAGIDCFLAARAMGLEGKVLGVDMTRDMVELATENARRMTAANVAFLLAEMEALPLRTGSVDVIISNCVINLSPDKDAVFREAFRVLRPGGRLHLSDILLEETLPLSVVRDLSEWVKCLAGAEQTDVYLNRMRLAGFTGLTVANHPVEGCIEEGISRVVSAEIEATKPA